MYVKLSSIEWNWELNRLTAPRPPTIMTFGWFTFAMRVVVETIKAKMISIIYVHEATLPNGTTATTRSV